MDTNIKIALLEQMEISANEVDLQVKLEEEKEGKFIKLLLLDNENNLIYSSYDYSNIMGFVNGIKYLTNKTK